jgi:hypothetical protein
LHKFGITCYFHKADQKRQKLEKKGEKGMFLGYDNNSTGYRVFILGTYKVVVSDEVLFEEDDDSHESENHAILREFPFSKEQTNDDEADNQSLFTQETIPMPKVPLFEPLAQPLIELQAEHPPEPLVNEHPPIEERDEAGPFHGFEEDDPYPNHHEYGVERDDPPSDEERVDIPAIANRRYPLRDLKPKVIHSMNLMDFDGQPFEPGSFSEAMGCHEAHLWKPSVQDEFDSHVQNGTWDLVPLPPGQTAIGTRWVFKVKPGFLDTPTRYKSRFVAKGYSQIKGIDFYEFAIYAPVVGYCSL